MKVLWLVNTMLPCIAEKLGREFSNKEGWLDGLSRQVIEYNNANRTSPDIEKIELGICFPVGPKEKPIKGSVTEGIMYYGFPEDTVNAHVYDEGLEKVFQVICREYQPDMVHIFGTEYPHTLALVKAYNNYDKTLIGIQGIISECGRKYMAFLPEKIRKRKTFRDIVKKDSTLSQQNKFVERGKYEIEAIRKCGHIAGRTYWDRKKCEEINSDIFYHRLDETLREVFYQGAWDYRKCNRHQIFVSQGNYPLKGLHLILEAVAELPAKYPDMKIVIAGDKITAYESFKDRLKIGNYGKYLRELIEKYRLEKHIEFTGNIPGETMKEKMLESNVFLMASSVENSSNSLGEAMLLGVPCVCSMVGGLPSIMEEDEGFYYKSGDVQAMKEALLGVFEDPDEAISRAAKAKKHALGTHDRKKNLELLLGIYKEIV